MMKTLALVAAALAVSVAAAAGTSRDRVPYEPASGKGFRIFTNDAWLAAPDLSHAREIRRSSAYKGDEPDFFVWTRQCLKGRQELRLSRTVTLLGRPSGGGVVTYNAYAGVINPVTLFEFRVNGHLLLRVLGNETQRVEQLSVADRRAFGEGLNRLEIRAVKKPTTEGCNDGNSAHDLGVRLQVTGVYRADLTTSQRPKAPLDPYVLVPAGALVAVVFEAEAAAWNKGPNPAGGGSVEATISRYNNGASIRGAAIQWESPFEICRGPGNEQEVHETCQFRGLDPGQKGRLKVTLAIRVPEVADDHTNPMYQFGLRLVVSELPGEPGTNYEYYRLDPNTANNDSLGFVRLCAPPIKTKEQCRARATPPT